MPQRTSPCKNNTNPVWKKMSDESIRDAVMPKYKNDKEGELEFPKMISSRFLVKTIFMTVVG